jgi:hypothetical protein
LLSHTLLNVSSIKAGRTVPPWLAVALALSALLVGYLVSHQISHRQTVEDYRRMGERFGESEVVQKAAPDDRPSICDSNSKWLVGKPTRSDDRVAAFFEGCSGLDADD